MDSIAVLIGIGTGILSALTFVGGMAAYYRSSVRKQYASERDYGHLKRNYEQLSMHVENLWKWVDESHEKEMLKLIEIEAKIERIIDKK